MSVITHLQNVKTKPEGIILNILVADTCIRSPFIISCEHISDANAAKDELPHLCNDQKLLFDFQSMKLE
jgi:hypothetical protein